MKTSELEELTDLNRDIYIPVISLDDTGRYNNYKINTSNLLDNSINKTISKVNDKLDSTNESLKQECDKIKLEASDKIDDLINDIDKDLKDSIDKANDFLKKYQQGESDIQSTLNNIKKELDNSILRSEDLLNDCETIFNLYFDDENGEFFKYLKNYETKISEINAAINQVKDFNTGLQQNKEYIDDQLSKIGWTGLSWNKDAQIYQELNSYIDNSLKVIQNNILTLKNSNTGETITDVISRVTEDAIENKVNSIDYVIYDSVDVDKTGTSKELPSNKYYYEIIPQSKYSEYKFTAINVDNLVFDIKLNITEFDNSTSNNILFTISSGEDSVTLFYDKENNAIKYTDKSDNAKTIKLQYKIAKLHITEDKFLVNDVDIKDNITESFFTSCDFELHINDTVEIEKYFVGGDTEDIEYLEDESYTSLPENYFEIDSEQTLSFKSAFPYIIKLKLVLTQQLSDLSVKQNQITANVAKQKASIEGLQKEVANLTIDPDQIKTTVINLLESDGTIETKISNITQTPEAIKNEIVNQIKNNNETIDTKFSNFELTVNGLESTVSDYSLIPVSELTKNYEQTVYTKQTLNLNKSYASSIVNNDFYNADYVEFTTDNVDVIESYTVNNKTTIIEQKEEDGVITYTPSSIKLLYKITDNPSINFNGNVGKFKCTVKGYRSNKNNFDWFKTSPAGLQNDILLNTNITETFDLNKGFNLLLNSGITYIFSWKTQDSLTYKIGDSNSDETISNPETKTLTKKDYTITLNKEKRVIIEKTNDTLTLTYKNGEAVSSLVHSINGLKLDNKKISENQTGYETKISEFEATLNGFESSINDVKYFKLYPSEKSDSVYTYNIPFKNIDYIISNATSYKLGDSSEVTINEPTTINSLENTILILKGCSDNTTVTYLSELALSQIKQDKEGITFESVATSITDSDSILNKAVLNVASDGISQAITDKSGALYSLREKADSSYKSLQKGGDTYNKIETAQTSILTINSDIDGIQSSLTLTSNDLNSKIESTNGEISTIKQTVNEIKETVGNNNGLDITNNCTYLANRTAGFKTTGTPDTTKTIDTVLDGFITDDTANGSGYLANGAIKWDGSGKLVIGGNVDFTTSTSTYGNDDLLYSCSLSTNANSHFNLLGNAPTNQWYSDLLLSDGSKWEYNTEAFSVPAIQGLDNWKLPDPEKYLGRTITLTGTIDYSAGGLILEAVVNGDRAESGDGVGQLFTNYMPKVTIEGNNLWIKWGCKAGAINSVDYLKYPAKFYKLGEFNSTLLSNANVIETNLSNRLLKAYGIYNDNGDVINDTNSFMPRCLGFDINGDLSNETLSEKLLSALNSDMALYLSPNILRRLESYENITVKLQATAKKESYMSKGNTSDLITIYYWEIQTTDFMPITDKFRYNIDLEKLLSNSGYDLTSLDDYYNNFEKPLQNNLGLNIRQVYYYEYYKQNS